jgi:hypothetical protein
VVSVQRPFHIGLPESKFLVEFGFSSSYSANSRRRRRFALLSSLFIT